MLGQMQRYQISVKDNEDVPLDPFPRPLSSLGPSPPVLHAAKPCPQPKPDLVITTRDAFYSGSLDNRHFHNLRLYILACTHRSACSRPQLMSRRPRDATRLTVVIAAQITRP